MKKETENGTLKGEICSKQCLAFLLHPKHGLHQGSPQRKKNIRPQTFGKKKGTPRHSSGGKKILVVIPNLGRFHAADSKLVGGPVRSLTGEKIPPPKDRSG